MLLFRLSFIALRSTRAILLALIISSGTAYPKDLTLAWDANPEPDITTYIVHFTSGSGAELQVDTGNNTTHLLKNLAPGNYRCAVTAKNAAGLESGPSDPLTFEIPGAPSSAITLAWDLNPEPEIATYVVHHGTRRGVYAQDLDVGNQATCRLTNLLPGRHYCIVTAKNGAGVESPPSDELEFDVPGEVPALVDLVNGQRLNGSAEVALRVSSPLPNVTRIEIYANNAKVGEADRGTQTATWVTGKPGDYSLTVKSYDGAGNSTVSNPVTVQVVRPALKDLRWNSNKAFEFTVMGAPQRTQHIYASEDLQQWTLLSSAINTTGTMLIQDSEASPRKQRFYRLVSE